MKQFSSIENTVVTYKNVEVSAKVVSITSNFNVDLDNFFTQELIKANTLKIVKPLAKITFVKENIDSPLWEEGFNYELIIKPFGLFNIWGVHHIKVLHIDMLKTEIKTEEKNNICKVWDHTLTFKKINEKEISYTDSVILYAGVLTSFLSYFLVYSYKMRHKNWNKLMAAKVKA
ncbi:hypothetical protein [Portibacter lacus]|uniref:Uncharacterized protein n=1 Tax=Portibacter lacus TaxID=1099794 RepID=A0AA37SLW2_9BACT|nr:hypothetical protein [Portibacter lacus]GLR16816.1 hypothetical protein GCM10007940_14310 [Portibacter lacus]